MNTLLRPAIVLFALLTLITGVAYPLVITLAGQAIFPTAANGSIVRDDAGKPIGSELIAQPFSSAGYFHDRPSATLPFPNNSAASSGSNLGPTNTDLLKAIGERVEAVRQENPEQTGPVPADLVTASASGLDPHISPAAAEYQVVRIARERGRSADDIRNLVVANTQGRTFGILGEPRVNVLLLNRQLDARFPK